MAGIHAGIHLYWIIVQQRLVYILVSLYISYIPATYDGFKCYFCRFKKNLVKNQTAEYVFHLSILV